MTVNSKYSGISHNIAARKCERSELLIWQVHQFELGCIKLHTPYRYKVHPKLYSDWSMRTVFYRVEFLNTFQHMVESTVVFRSSFKIMARRTSDAGVQDAGVEECKGYSPPLPLGSWNSNTGTRPTESRVARKRAKYAQRTEQERLHDAHQKCMPGVSWRQPLGGASPATDEYGLLHRDLKTRFCS